MRKYRLLTPLVALAVILWGLWLAPAEPAELRVRKELLVQQADRALITATGRFDHVKEAVNSLQADCDLHAPVRVHEIKVAVVGEFMNACSTALDPAEVTQWTKEADGQIDGVFRVWFEHPGKKDDVLTEEEPVGPYRSSNPPHAVEIHPIVRIRVGGTEHKFFDAIRAIEKDGQAFKAKGTAALRTLLKRKIAIQAFDGSDGEEYISIESGCCLPNYFRLEAVLKATPKKTDDGHWAVMDILDGQTTLARGIRLFSIEGTKVDTAFKGLKKNTRFSFWAITRLDLSQVVKAADENGGEPFRLPFELVLLAIEE